MNYDQPFMQRALELAKDAQKNNEVPIGAVVVLNNEVIGEGFNSPISTQNPTAHAEMMAIQKASQKIHNYRLVDCTLYVTIEPCLMCAGAIIHSRIKRLVFGAHDKKFGACGSIINIFDKPWNHKVIVEHGLLKEECAQLLKNFFQSRR